MAELNSYPLNNTLYIAEDAQLWHATRLSGVYAADGHYNVTASNGMSVTVSTGIGWMKVGEFAGIVFANKSVSTLIIETADGLLPRIDRVVIRNDFIANKVVLAIRKGTPAVNPVAPALQRNSDAFELGIADVRVNAGAISITQANIQDLRLNESLCGIMRDGVTGIPTQALYDSWWLWFSALKGNAETQAADFLSWLEIFRATNEREFESWVANFKQTSQSDFDSWYSGFTSASSNNFVNWYNAFTENSESDFNAWFENLQNTLDENQASNLFNMIDAHERTNITDSAEGVHGIRLHEGKFQAFVGIGWATLGVLPVGFIGSFFNAQNFNGFSFNLRNFTGTSFDNVIRIETEA